MKKPFRLLLAQNEQQRADAARVRLRVYAEEERMLPSSALQTGWDGDRRELADPSTRFLVYVGDEPVGTIGLHVAPAAGLAPESAPGLGAGHRLELEAKFVLSGFEQPGLVLAEVTGYCVRRRFRGTRVTPALFAALGAESARQGVTHWLAAANMETDSVEDAAIAYRLLLQKDLISTVFGARPRSLEPPPARGTRFVYTREQRSCAQRGELDQLKLPRTLSLFATKMGARYLGPPAYDRDFNVFSAPLAVEVASIGVRTALARARHDSLAEPKTRVSS